MTKKEQVLEIMRDYQWHCCVCEFSSSQPAAIFRDLRKAGYKFEEDPKRHKFTSVRRFCEKCNRDTEHRKLIGEPND